MSCTLSQLEELVGEIAPWELAEEWDNVGLLLGRRDQTVNRVLVALDVTEAVLEEARAFGAEAVVTHHPFMFKPVSRLTDETREGRLMLEMARLGMGHIAAHTNLDAAPEGVNETLLSLMSCTNLTGEGCLRVGDLEEMTFGELCRRAGERLHAQVRTYGEPDRLVHRLGCCSGAGSGEYAAALALGADCFLTGEVRHNLALDALDAGLCILEAGHFETERPVCAVVARSLQKRADALEYGLSVRVSQADVYNRAPSRRNDFAAV